MSDEPPRRRRLGALVTIALAIASIGAPGALGKPGSVGAPGGAVNDQTTDIVSPGTIQPAETSSYPACAQGGCAYIGSGQSGDHVEAVQACLRARGLDVEVDGHFGPQTEEGVSAYQSAAGLSADGVVGSGTFHALGLHQSPAGNCG